jgi:hypothetical protein
MTKTILSASAIVLTFALFYPYVRSILQGNTKPHTFSWVIWGLGTSAVFFAQLAGGAGIGAWPIGLSALITCYVALLSWMKRADLRITALDWACLVAAIFSVMAWAFTSNPLWAVLILTAIDLVGFGPTIRKAHSKPHEERIWFFLLGALRNALVVGALEHYSVTTIAFPAVVGVACVALALFIALRRLSLRESQVHRAA